MIFDRQSAVIRPLLGELAVVLFVDQHSQMHGTGALLSAIVGDTGQRRTLVKDVVDQHHCSAL